MCRIRNTYTGRLLASSHSGICFDDKPLEFETKADACMFIRDNNLSSIYAIEEDETVKSPVDELMEILKEY